MCTKRIEVNPQNINFIITNTILSMKNSFTCKQVIEELKKYSIDNENTIKKAIVRLRDNDYLEESGSYYRVLNDDESNRWGIY